VSGDQENGSGGGGVQKVGSQDDMCSLLKSWERNKTSGLKDGEVCSFVLKGGPLLSAERRTTSEGEQTGIRDRLFLGNFKGCTQPRVDDSWEKAGLAGVKSWKPITVRKNGGRGDKRRDLPDKSISSSGRSLGSGGKGEVRGGRSGGMVTD